VARTAALGVVLPLLAHHLPRWALKGMLSVGMARVGAAAVAVAKRWSAKLLSRSASSAVLRAVPTTARMKTMAQRGGWVTTVAAPLGQKQRKSGCHRHGPSRIRGRKTTRGRSRIPPATAPAALSKLHAAQAREKRGTAVTIPREPRQLRRLRQFAVSPRRRTSSL